MRRDTSLSPQGFTLVELLVVIVILGVLGAVGIPAVLNQAPTARVNAANQAVMAAAKACAALRVTAETGSYEPFTGVTSSTGCTPSGPNTFTSDASEEPFSFLTTQAQATLSDAGTVNLTQTAVSP